MSLFKYVDTQGLLIFESGRIKFAVPQEFNDPFDLRPTFFLPLMASELSAKITSVGKIIQETLPPHLTTSFIKATTTLMDPESPDHQRLVRTEEKNRGRFWNLAFDQELYSKVAFLCLSEVADSELMWAHYADQHRGFVIEFDENHGFFGRPELQEDSFDRVQKMNYSNQRPVFTGRPGQMYPAFFTKGSVWSYEKEWRLGRVLSDAVVIEGRMHLYDLPMLSVKSLVLGCKMNAAIRAKLLGCLSRRKDCSHIKIKEAAPDRNRFLLQINEV